MAIKNDAKGRPRKQGSFGLYREGKATPEILFTVQVVLTARRWRALLDEQLRPIGQSSARMEALSAIYNSPPLSPQVDIARRLRIEGPTLTRMLDTLEKDGLVERLADPADRRTKLLKVTRKGERALEDIFDIADEMRGRLLDGIDDRKIAEINEFFGELLTRLDSGLPDYSNDGGSKGGSSSDQ